METAFNLIANILAWEHFFHAVQTALVVCLATCSVIPLVISWRGNEPDGMGGESPPLVLAGAWPNRGFGGGVYCADADGLRRDDDGRSDAAIPSVVRFLCHHGNEEGGLTMGLKMRPAGKTGSGGPERGNHPAL